MELNVREWKDNAFITRGLLIADDWVAFMVVFVDDKKLSSDKDIRGAVGNI